MPVSHRACGLYGQARMVNAYGHPKTCSLAGDSRLFLLSWHRRDVDPSNAEDDMKPSRSSPANKPQQLTVETVQTVVANRRDRRDRSN